MAKLPIDNEEVLNHYYDDRETFVVDYDDRLVKIEIQKGSVTFRLRRDD